MTNCLASLGHKQKERTGSTRLSWTTSVVYVWSLAFVLLAEAWSSYAILYVLQMGGVPLGGLGGPTMDPMAALGMPGPNMNPQMQVWIVNYS